LDRGRELELLACPKSFAKFLGFEPGPNFLGTPSDAGSISIKERR
jgi:hypothetical protein